MLEEMIGAVKMLRVQIVQCTAPLKEALCQCGMTMLEDIGRGMEVGIAPREGWENVRIVATMLKTAELSAMDRLFERLGSVPLPGQSEAIDACIAVLECQRANAEHCAQRAAKMYTSLGLLTGLSMAVLLI